MIRAFALGLAVLIASPIGATACSAVSYAESGQIIETRNLARDMVGAAATVDLVELEHAEPIDTVAFFAAERAEMIARARPEWVADVRADYDAYEADYRRWGASTLTFRVIERLKGPIPVTSFTLSGFYVRHSDEMYAALSASDRGQPRQTLPTGEELYMRHLVELKDWGGSGSCAAPLQVVEGVRYLVFRDTEGALLYDGAPVLNGPSKPVAPGVRGMVAEPATEGDAWLSAVRSAAR